MRGLNRLAVGPSLGSKSFYAFQLSRCLLEARLLPVKNAHRLAAGLENSGDAKDPAFQLGLRALRLR